MEKKTPNYSWSLDILFALEKFTPQGTKQRRLIEHS